MTPQEMADGYRNGATILQLATDSGHKYNTVRRHLIGQGVTLRKQGFLPKDPPARSTVHERARRARAKRVRLMSAEIRDDLHLQTWPDGASVADLTDYYGYGADELTAAVALMFREGRLRVVR